MRPDGHASRKNNGAEVTTPQNKPRRRARRAPAGFHTVAALAAAGDPPRSSLYRYIKTGLLPAHRWRGQYVVAHADYQNLLAVTPTPVAVDDADGKLRRHD